MMNELQAPTNDPTSTVENENGENKSISFEDILSGLEGETEASNEEQDEIYEAEIIGEVESEAAEENDQGDDDPEGSDQEDPNQDGTSYTDKEFAESISVLIDIVFSVAWGLLSSQDALEYRMNIKARKEVAKALVPLMGGLKEELSPGWLVVFMLLALQLPNGIKAYDTFNKNQQKKRAKKNKQKYENAEETEVEILDQEGNPVKEFGQDGKKHPKTKRCGYCGQFGHNKATCQKRKDDETKAKEK